jgi:hypothetical protein
VEIRLETPEDLIYSFGVTDDRGKFQLMFDSRKSGIIPGRKRLILIKKGTSEQDEAPGDAREKEETTAGSAAIPTDGPVIPDCFGRESTTFIDIDSSTKYLDLKLNSDCSQL